MSMYKGFAIGVKVKPLGTEEIITTTDKPFEWFPELEKLCENIPKIINIKIEIENTESQYIRKYFLIEKI